MGVGGEDYSNVAAGGQVNVTHPMHASQHEDGGSDEISVEGLAGVLTEKQDADKIQGVDVSAVAPTDAQVMIYDGGDERWEPTDHPAPNPHKTSHQNEGDDEISVAGLSGELADEQSSAWVKVSGKPSTFAPSAHKTSHQNEGTDEISLAGLGGATLTLTFIIDGGGGVITTGEKGHLEIPFACIIERVTMLADRSGSIVVDIWKDTYAEFPPVDEDSITASAPPTITTAQKSQDATLTGWTTSITSGDILAFNVDGCTSIRRVTISLKVMKS